VKWWWCKTHDIVTCTRTQYYIYVNCKLPGSCVWVEVEPPKPKDPPLDVDSFGDLGVTLHAWGNEGVYRETG
jgi:hypothetical protein